MKKCAILAQLFPTLLIASETNWHTDLEKRYEALEQKLKILERKLELQDEAQKAKSATVVSAGGNGFTIRSADTNFVLKLRGYVQADARFYPDDHAAGTANDTFLLRRVRPIFEGTVFEKYDYRIMLDFGSGVSAWNAFSRAPTFYSWSGDIRPSWCRTVMPASKFKGTCLGEPLVMRRGFSMA